MKKFMKLLTMGILVGGVLSSVFINVQAKTVSYLVKDKVTGTVYEYGVEQLRAGFLNYKSSGTDVLYTDFTSKLSKNGYYSFYDDTKKYVDYNSIMGAFLEAKTSNIEFKLDSYTASTSAAAVKDLPSTITNVDNSTGNIKYVAKNPISTTTDLEVISIE